MWHRVCKLLARAPQHEELLKSLCKLVAEELAVNVEIEVLKVRCNLPCRANEARGLLGCSGSPGTAPGLVWLDRYLDGGITVRCRDIPQSVQRSCVIVRHNAVLADRCVTFRFSNYNGSDTLWIVVFATERPRPFAVPILVAALEKD